MAADSEEPIRKYNSDQNAHSITGSPSLSSPTTPPSTSTDRPYQGKIYETFTPSPSSAITPPENANTLPGGTMNTAGGRPKQATVLDAVRAIKLEDFRNVHHLPCVRDAFLFGIGSGFALGGGRLAFGTTIWKSMHWAIGAFCLGSAGMFEFCQRRRALEKQGMARAAEIIDQKKLKIERERERVRAERRRRKEEDDTAREERDREQEQNSKKEWKFWEGR